MKFTNYYGIDISKSKFDVVDQSGVHTQYSNDLAGFEMFSKALEEGSCCVMESTGVYHQQLANYLCSKDIYTSVVNPIVTKRFMQLHLRRHKTDKADAEMLCAYAQQYAAPRYTPPPAYLSACRMLFDNMELLLKTRTMYRNRIHASEAQYGKESKCTRVLFERMIRLVNKELKALERRLYDILQQESGELFTRIQSIPGIGKKTAVMLVLLSDNFTKFATAKQFICYVGLSPIERSSGSTIHGMPRISKQGNPLMRKLLFMCSFQASKHNAACRSLFHRIVSKGKCKKVALIAVANKLIKQAFGIAKSGLVYDPEYRSTYSGKNGPAIDFK